LGTGHPHGAGERGHIATEQPNGQAGQRGMQGEEVVAQDRELGVLQEDRPGQAVAVVGGRRQVELFPGKPHQPGGAIPALSNVSQVPAGERIGSHHAPW
jgi:hypothetical protein